MENVIFNELIRRGYKVYIGKVADLEIDFVAEKNGEKTYYQVAATVMEESTLARELVPLKRVQDNYPKYIITMDDLPSDEDGIKVVNVIDFLMESS